MTPQERAVIEAARALVPIFKKADEVTKALSSKQKGDGYVEAMTLVAVVEALPSDPAPADAQVEAVGETVVAFADHGGGVHFARAASRPSWASGWQPIGTIRLQPIPATVEPAK